MSRHIRIALLLVLLFGAIPYSFSQFSGSLTGTVSDPSGSVVPHANLVLTNTSTNVSQTTQSDAQGVYHFNSLAPGQYQLTTEMQGFSRVQNSLTLETSQTLNFNVHMVVGSTSQTVQVTTQSPLLDTADTRIQETLTTKTLSDLPLAGRNMISLVTLAPGMTGLGVTSNGSPGSGRDNYSTETQVDASANGQGAVGNLYIVDGLDVTSSIRPGVLNMTPNPDVIQEASLQTNTYNVDYGRASGVEMLMTTKSGTSAYHGNASDYFTYQGLFAGTEFTHSYAPFHSNNISATIGGPIIPHHQAFFFFGIEPTPSSAGTAENITFEDPQFTQFAEANFPNTVGTSLLKNYPVSKIGSATVTETAATAFTGCGTAATSFIPCTLPVIDSANYTDSAYRNGLQYMVRIDKPFQADRLYGTFFRTTLSSSTPNPRAAFDEGNSFHQFALQVNESHTFSPNTLNQASFAVIRIEGVQPATGLFDVPVVNVTGVGQGFGAGFAQGDFIQHNYHWRDVLTRVYKSHNISAGLEGLFGDDVEKFAGPYDQPTFQFNNLLDLAQDNVYTETGAAYSPLTGQKIQYLWNAAGTTYGAFIEDTWKAASRVTLNYGLRWDDFGNPYQRSTDTVFGNFFLGPGQTEQEQIANGFVLEHHHALNRSITDVFSPRVGVAWDITGNGKWLIKSGFGIFHNWPTLANLQEEYRGNPPGPIFPTFYGGQTPAPVFALGTSNQQPFGFPYPTFPAEQLDSKGGLQGLQFNIGGINPNLVSPVSYIYSGGLERSLNTHLVAGVSYSGSQGTDLLSGGGQVYNVSYGQDINELPGDLIIHNSTVPTRLNTSFGEVLYTDNDRVSSYNALILSLSGRFPRAFFNASYTRSSSMDDTQVYPSYINPHQYFAPSIWDVPNRFSLAWNYQFPSPNRGLGLVGRVGGGWEASGTTILQSGNPFTVSTNAAFSPLVNASGTYTGYASGSGDYNADGDNFDFPDAQTYAYGTSRKDYLQGIFKAGQFTAPSTFGAEGNEKYDAFRGPGFEEWDASLLKNTKITEGTAFQLRFEFFNLFNRPNLNTVDTNLPDSNFGRATNQYTPRFLQIGGNLTF